MIWRFPNNFPTTASASLSLVFVLSLSTGKGEDSGCMQLKRDVIPKQYVEKYFPLDAEAGDKGLLLSFQDENGKIWRFCYSYWTSSQSYVLTKGWSRFVKEKRKWTGFYYGGLGGGVAGDAME